MSAVRTLAVGALLLAAAGCRQDMHNQPRLEPYETSRFYADGQASRLPPPGTVGRGQLREDDLLHRGLTPAGTASERLPMPLTAKLLSRGRDQFQAFCSPCHGPAGNGRGMVVRRGFKQPTSFHDQRLRTSPVGYFFDVMTNGFATMPSYASQIPVEERWAIAAYIRALQLSQNARLAELPADVGAAVAAAEAGAVTTATSHAQNAASAPGEGH